MTDSKKPLKDRFFHFWRKLSFGQQISVILTGLSALLIIATYNVLNQQTSLTYNSSASEPIEPQVEFSPPSGAVVDYQQAQMQVGEEKRTVGRIQSLTPTDLILETAEGPTAQFALNENTVFIKRVPLAVAPDADGAVPLEKIQLSIDQVSLGDQVDVAWQEDGAFNRAILINLLD